MLSELKFGRKVLSDTVTGKERFSVRYLYKNETEHITITLAKDSFIKPKFRKAGKDANFDIFSFVIDDSSVPKEMKENN